MDTESRWCASSSTQGSELVSFRAKYKAAIHRVIYRLLADHYGNRMDLESALGGDLIDTIWQTPYERLRPREQERFDRVIDGIIERIGTDKTFQVVILDSRLRVEEIIELTHAWRWMEMVKEGRITEDQDLVESEEESREDEAIMLLSECKIALEFLKINSGFPFPGVIVNLEEKLQEYFKFPEDEAGSKGAQDQLPQADAQQPGTDSVVAKTTSQELTKSIQ